MFAKSEVVPGSPEYALALRTKVGVTLAIGFQSVVALVLAIKSFAERSWAAYLWSAIACAEIALSVVAIAMVIRMRRAIR